MQNAETKLRSKKRAMVLPNKVRVSVWIAVAAIAFLALQAVAVVASAHETGSPHEELPPPWPYHVLLVTAGFVVMLGGMLTARFMQFRLKDKRMHIIHRWTGRLAIAVVLINIATGWMMIQAM